MTDELDFEKTLAEVRKLNAETGKLVAEQSKLFAEQSKLFAEGRKFNRDPWFVAVGALIAFMTAVLTRPEILRAFGFHG